MKRALGMPNLLKIQFTSIEHDPNIAINCNNYQIYNKNSTIDAQSFKNTA